MRLPLKQAVQEHLQARQLDQHQLVALSALQSRYAKADSGGGQRRRWYRVAGVVAASLLLALLLPRTMHEPPGNDLIAEIAAEVVQNHLHRKPLEIRSDRLETVRGYFTGLHFMPVASAYLDSIDPQLMGGRYCSLQGVTAAQLRFKTTRSDEVHTLYQVDYDPEVFRTMPDYDRGETPVSTWSGGVKVTLWVEKGILFALTEEQEARP